MKGIIPPTLHHEGNYTPNPPPWRELYPQPSIMKGIINHYLFARLQTWWQNNKEIQKFFKADESTFVSIH
jgi:hypothetical protein